MVVPSDSEGGKLLNISLASVADNIGERPVPCIAIRASRDDEFVSDLHTTGRTGRKTMTKSPNDYEMITHSVLYARDHRFALVDEPSDEITSDEYGEYSPPSNMTSPPG